MRFQLDPRAQRPERPAPPSAPPAPAPTGETSGLAPLPPRGGPAPAAAPPPGIPRPRPAAAPRKDRTKLYAGILVAILLLSGSAMGALYLTESPPFEYPRRYMLEGDEIPDRMTLAEVPADARNELGLEENPGPIRQETLDDMGQGFAPSPEEGWAEVLTPVSQEAPVMVIALRFTDKDDADDWTGLLRTQCSRGGGIGALLQDGEVAVLVVAEGTTGQAWVGRVVERLLEEAPDLRRHC